MYHNVKPGSMIIDKSQQSARIFFRYMNHVWIGTALLLMVPEQVELPVTLEP